MRRMKYIIFVYLLPFVLFACFHDNTFLQCTHYMNIYHHHVTFYRSREISTKKKGVSEDTLPSMDICICKLYIRINNIKGKG